MFDVTEIVDSAFEETTETAETDIEVEETTEESTTSPAETPRSSIMLRAAFACSMPSSVSGESHHPWMRWRTLKTV